MCLIHISKHQVVYLKYTVFICQLYPSKAQTQFSNILTSTKVVEKTACTPGPLALALVDVDVTTVSSLLQRVHEEGPGLLSGLIWQWRQQAICCHLSCRILRTCLPSSRHVVSHYYWQKVPWFLLNVVRETRAPWFASSSLSGICTKEKLCLLCVVNSWCVYLCSSNVSASLYSSFSNRTMGSPCSAAFSGLDVHIFMQ